MNESSSPVSDEKVLHHLPSIGNADVKTIHEHFELQSSQDLFEHDVLEQTIDIHDIEEQQITVSMPQNQLYVNNLGKKLHPTRTNAVNKVTMPLSGDREYKLFFKPLDKNLTRETVQSQLSQLGRIRYFRMPYSEKKLKNLGYGFVFFESKALSDILCEQHIAVLIGNHGVKFQKFSLQKHQSKKVLYKESSSDSFKVTLSNPNPPMSLKNQNTMFSREMLTLKPTHKRYYSKFNHYNSSNKNLRFCLESR